jgi:acetate kinase
MKVLVCNAGSTSLKFKLYEMPSCLVLAKCKIERVGSRDDAIFQYVNQRDNASVNETGQDVPDYDTGISRFLKCLTDPKIGLLSDIREIERVGYKATVSKGHLGVHELTDEVIQGMRDWLPIAPQHNAAYLATMDVMRKALPDALFLGAFETAFHQTVPLERRLYGIPYEWYEEYGIVRLGYHSASHGYMADLLNAEFPKGYRAVSCHLGGSSSVCAIVNGKSVDTSFGMSLQSGLIHATRVGDMDCDLVNYLRHVGLSDAQINDGFQKNGGILGLSGVSGDLRYVEDAAANGNKRAQLSLDVFAAGIVKYIGSFYVEMGGLDVLLFTGGIGENSDVVRRLVCSRLQALHVSIDEEKNLATRGEGVISTPGSGVLVKVAPTDEELGIARRTFEYVRNQ